MKKAFYTKGSKHRIYLYDDSCTKTSVIITKVQKVKNHDWQIKNGEGDYHFFYEYAYAKTGKQIGGCTEDYFIAQKTNILAVAMVMAGV